MEQMSKVTVMPSENQMTVVGLAHIIREKMSAGLRLDRIQSTSTSLVFETKQFGEGDDESTIFEESEFAMSVAASLLGMMH